SVNRAAAQRRKGCRANRKACDGERADAVRARRLAHTQEDEQPDHAEGEPRAHERGGQAPRYGKSEELAIAIEHGTSDLQELVVVQTATMRRRFRRAGSGRTDALVRP